MIQLVTRWGKNLDREHVLKEYPRPGLVRDSYLNLNGEWDYYISNKKGDGVYDGKILVPFSPESMLSGVEKILQPDQYLHYRKRFHLPDGFVKNRVLLHFGGVDQECEIFINGVSVGSHVGGYLPFSFDITKYLKEENELHVVVTDKTELAPHARGKQKLHNHGGMSSLFYTPQSGIWKTVWIESVPNAYIEQLKITPLYDEASVKIRVIANDSFDQPVTIKVLDQGTVIASAETEANHHVVIPMGGFKSWSPENPFLYDLEIQMGEDVV
ncbi:MAG: glycoside hydrolase family 2, partial [Lachnospiraceae bacterium]|nr:glycoside hydrolase family 2 [Lachnospiraceae bacterium]